MRFLKMFSCELFSKSDPNCFLSCVYDLRPVEKKKFRQDNLSEFDKKINRSRFN